MSVPAVAAPDRRTERQKYPLQRIYAAVMPPFRRRRMRLLSQLLPITPQTRVLDVGGGEMIWRWCEPTPRVTILNLSSGDIVADGRQLPFADGSFEVVFSNSVIEHVGSPEDQEAFAREIARVGQRYFVQTPNRHFPVEPHYLTPLFQFLPPRLQLGLARYLTVWGLVARPSKAEIEARVRQLRLLTPRALCGLFPDARLHRERMLGLAKSLIMVKV